MELYSFFISRYHKRYKALYNINIRFGNGWIYSEASLAMKCHFTKRLTNLYPRAKLCLSHWSFMNRFIWVFDYMQDATSQHAPIGSSLYIHWCRFPCILEAKPLIYISKTSLYLLRISHCEETVEYTLKFWIRIRAYLRPCFTINAASIENIRSNLIRRH